jgi:hypothetical protein
MEIAHEMDVVGNLGREASLPESPRLRGDVEGFGVCARPPDER